ncbi:MAG: transcriptional regulator NanR [Granulosicoccus sp.]
MSKSLLKAAPIVRKKLGDQVYEQLLSQIEAGDLVPGDYLPSERELMKQFDVGRPAIREALQLLHSNGLIIISHGERSKVRTLNASVVFQQMDNVAKLLLSQEPSNLDNLKQLRRIFETGVIELAAIQCTDKDVSALYSILSQQRSQLGNAEAFIQHDIAFHSRIAEISGNPLMKVVAEVVLAWIFEHHNSLLHWSGREETTLLEHEKIIDYLAVNDADGAVKMLSTHLDRSDQIVKMGICKTTN